MPSFQERKSTILQSLSVPDHSYSDASPKGSVDEGIRNLVDEINRLDGYVTTSSCAGRIAVYLEGSSKTSKHAMLDSGEGKPLIAKTGGKGGGEWLFVSHDPVDLTSLSAKGALMSLLGLPIDSHPPSVPASTQGMRFVHLKFEPMILHVLTSSLAHAQKALSAASTAGFRESGISSITSDDTTMVAVRSSGLSFDNIIACVDDSGALQSLVTEDCLRLIMAVANQRFETNTDRKERFRLTLASNIDSTHKQTTAWESTEERRERKRAEGLRRQKELQETAEVGSQQDDEMDLEMSFP